MNDIKTRLWFEDGDITVERVQDVEPIIDQNKRLQALPQKRAGSFRHIGTIPNVILERWIVEDGVNYLALSKEEFDRMIMRKLRDPDWKWLRTGEGRI